MKHCSYEIAPYTGTGEDPPTCDAPATCVVGGNSLCEQHARWVEQSQEKLNIASLCTSPIACEVADAWEICRRVAPNLYASIMLTELGFALQRQELATRSSSIRKTKP